MKPFYFVEDRELTHPPKELGYFFDADNSHSSILISAKGPHGGGGTLFVSHDDQFKVRSITSEQAWREVEGIEGVWLGWIESKPPAPEELVRRIQHDGHFVELADGQKWMIPAAQKVDCDNEEYVITSRIPRCLTMRGGELVYGSVPAKYARLWKIAEVASDHVAASVNDSDEIVLSIPDAFSYCCELLELNYRVSVSEVAIFELLTEPLMSEVFLMLLDFPATKKKGSRSEDSSTEAGKTAAIPTTDQHTPIYS